MTLPITALPENIGQYHLGRVLGYGATGVVLEASHACLDRPVAIKVLRPEAEDRDTLTRRFYREVSVLGRLSNRYVVHATDAGVVGEILFLVMEYLDGVNLDQLVARLGPLPVSEACEAARQVALGLAYIASRRLVHRDIKPTNLQLTTGGDVKILDLGLVRIQELSSSEATPANALLGTVDYLAPEQARAPSDTDIRADVYSLGCTLYFLLTGHVPFPDDRFESVAQKVFAHQHEPFPELDRGDVPPGLRALVRRLTAKTPQGRPWPADLADELARHAEGADLAGWCSRALAVPADPMPEIERLKTTARGLETLRPGDAPGESPEEPVVLDAPTIPYAALPTATPPRSPRRVLILTSGVLLIALAGFMSVPPPAVVRDAAGWQLDWLILRDLDKFPVNQEVDLLELPPQPRLFLYTDDSLAGWDWLPERRSLIVHCHGQSLFLFGKTEAKNYTYRVRLRQSPWSEGVVIVLGYQPDPNPPDPVPPSEVRNLATFQALCMERNPREAKSRAVQPSYRRRFSVHREVGQRQVLSPGSGIATTFVDERKGDQDVTFRVRDGRVDQISVNNIVVQGLITPRGDTLPTAGALGVSVWRATGITISNAFFVREE